MAERAHQRPTGLAPGPMTSNSSSIQIRPLKTIDELKAVEELQLAVWGCSEREVLPSLALIPLMDIGGVVVGAFEDQKLVGFVVGFPGLQAGTAILHSDMLAVKAEYRSSGLGYKLKLAQRNAALAQGIKRITWTFDPLQSANAYFNFAKLRVIADHYKINYYGESSSPLHRTGTDRLWVTWLLESSRVKERMTGKARTPLPDMAELPSVLKLGNDGEPVLQTPESSQTLRTIEIPADINRIAASNISLANRWREATRAAFTASLSEDFLVEDFFRDAGEEKVGRYLLTRSQWNPLRDQ